MKVINGRLMRILNCTHTVSPEIIHLLFVTALTYILCMYLSKSIFHWLYHIVYIIRQVKLSCTRKYIEIEWTVWQQGHRLTIKSRFVYSTELKCIEVLFVNDVKELKLTIHLFLMNYIWSICSVSFNNRTF